MSDKPVLSWITDEMREAVSDYLLTVKESRAVEDTVMLMRHEIENMLARSTYAKNIAGSVAAQACGEDTIHGKRASYVADIVRQEERAARKARLIEKYGPLYFADHWDEEPSIYG